MINFSKKNLLFMIIGVCTVIGLFVFNGKHEPAKTIDVRPIVATKKKEPTKEQETKAYVDVKGEVKTPGVYEVPIKSRVEDVINLAGGFTNQANQSVINLAQKVHDEMIILVPEVGESVEIGTENGGASPTKINLNNATQEEIEQLNGIGPSKAQAIIKFREENGPFQLIEDVRNVPGIGEKTLENMKEYIQVP